MITMITRTVKQGYDEKLFQKLVAVIKTVLSNTTPLTRKVDEPFIQTRIGLEKMFPLGSKHKTTAIAADREEVLRALREISKEDTFGKCSRGKLTLTAASEKEDIYFLNVVQ